MFKNQDKLRYGDMIFLNFKDLDNYYTVSCESVDSTQDTEVVAEKNPFLNFSKTNKTTLRESIMISMSTKNKDINELFLNSRELDNSLFIILPPIDDKILTFKKNIDEKLHQLLLLSSDNVNENFEVSDIGGISNNKESNFNSIFNKEAFLNNNNLQKKLISEELSNLILEYNKLKSEIIEENYNSIITETESNCNNQNKFVKFSEKFMLMHYKTKMFLSTSKDTIISSSINLSDNKKSFLTKIELVELFDDECIFFFSPHNKFDCVDDNIYTDQTLLLMKGQKSIYQNNVYVSYSNVNDNDKNDCINIREKRKEATDIRISERNNHDNNNYDINNESDKFNKNGKNSTRKSRVCSDEKLETYNRKSINDNNNNNNSNEKSNDKRNTIISKKSTTRTFSLESKYLIGDFNEKITSLISNTSISQKRNSYFSKLNNNDSKRRKNTILSNSSINKISKIGTICQIPNTPTYKGLIQYNTDEESEDSEQKKLLSRFNDYYQQNKIKSTKQKNRNYKKIMHKKNKKYVLHSTEDTNKAFPFQLAIFSNEINPISNFLSFSNYFYLSCQGMILGVEEKEKNVVCSNNDFINIKKNSINRLSRSRGTRGEYNSIPKDFLLRSNKKTLTKSNSEISRSIISNFKSYSKINNDRKRNQSNELKINKNYNNERDSKLFPNKEKTNLFFSNFSDPIANTNLNSKNHDNLSSVQYDHNTISYFKCLLVNNHNNTDLIQTNSLFKIEISALDCTNTNNNKGKYPISNYLSKRESIINTSKAIFSKSLENFFIQNNTNSSFDYRNKLSPYIYYNQVLRLRHIVSGKYMAFSNLNTKINIYNADSKAIHFNKNYTNKNSRLNENNLANSNTHRKEFLNEIKLNELILKDSPDEDSEWMLMESYIVLNKDKYEYTKAKGLDFNNDDGYYNSHFHINSSNDNKNYHIYKNDIIRLFHIKTRMFLSIKHKEFNKYRESNSNNTDNNNNKNYSDCLSLSKNPYDHSLFHIKTINDSIVQELDFVVMNKIMVVKIKSSINNNQPLLISSIKHFIDHEREEETNNEINNINKRDNTVSSYNSKAKLNKKQKYNNSNKRIGLNTDFSNNTLNSKNNKLLDPKTKIEIKLEQNGNILEQLNLSITSLFELSSIITTMIKFINNTNSKMFDTSFKITSILKLRQNLILEQGVLREIIEFMMNMFDNIKNYNSLIQKFINPLFNKNNNINNVNYNEYDDYINYNSFIGYNGYENFDNNEFNDIIHEDSNNKFVNTNRNTERYNSGVSNYNRYNNYMPYINSKNSNLLFLYDNIISQQVKEHLNLFLMSLSKTVFNIFLFFREASRNNDLVKSFLNDNREILFKYLVIYRNNLSLVVDIFDTEIDLSNSNNKQFYPSFSNNSKYHSTITNNNTNTNSNIRNSNFSSLYNSKFLNTPTIFQNNSFNILESIFLSILFLQHSKNNEINNNSNNQLKLKNKSFSNPLNNYYIYQNSENTNITDNINSLNNLNTNQNYNIEILKLLAKAIKSKTFRNIKELIIKKLFLYIEEDEIVENKNNYLYEVIKNFNNNNNNDNSDNFLPSLQQLILLNTAVISSNIRNLFIKIEPSFNNLDFLIIYKNNSNEFVFTSLIKLASISLNSKSDDNNNIKNNNENDYESRVCFFLAEQLNFFASLCHNSNRKNEKCIEKIREMFPLDYLLYNISVVNLREEVLAGLIDVLNECYIDVFPHSFYIMQFNEKGYSGFEEINENTDNNNIRNNMDSDEKSNKSNNENNNFSSFQSESSNSNSNPTCLEGEEEYSSISESILKIIDLESLKILTEGESIEIRTIIPQQKLNVILCLSLYFIYLTKIKIIKDKCTITVIKLMNNLIKSRLFLKVKYDHQLALRFNSNSSSNNRNETNENKSNMKKKKFTESILDVYKKKQLLKEEIDKNYNINDIYSNNNVNYYDDNQLKDNILVELVRENISKRNSVFINQFLLIKNRLNDVSNKDINDILSNYDNNTYNGNGYKRKIINTISDDCFYKEIGYVFFNDENSKEEDISTNINNININTNVITYNNTNFDLKTNSNLLTPKNISKSYSTKKNNNSNSNNLYNNDKILNYSNNDYLNLIIKFINEILNENLILNTQLLMPEVSKRVLYEVYNKKNTRSNNILINSQVNYLKKTSAIIKTLLQSSVSCESDSVNPTIYSHLTKKEDKNSDINSNNFYNYKDSLNNNRKKTSIINLLFPYISSLIKTILTIKKEKSSNDLIQKLILQSKEIIAKSNIWKKSRKNSAKKGDSTLNSNSNGQNSNYYNSSTSFSFLNFDDIKNQLTPELLINDVNIENNENVSFNYNSNNHLLFSNDWRFGLLRKLKSLLLKGLELSASDRVNYLFSSVLSDISYMNSDVVTIIKSSKLIYSYKEVEIYSKTKSLVFMLGEIIQSKIKCLSINEMISKSMLYNDSKKIYNGPFKAEEVDNEYNKSLNFQNNSDTNKSNHSFHKLIDIILDLISAFYKHPNTVTTSTINSNNINNTKNNITKNELFSDSMKINSFLYYLNFNYKGAYSNQNINIKEYQLLQFIHFSMKTEILLLSFLKEVNLILNSHFNNAAFFNDLNMSENNNQRSFNEFCYVKSELINWFADKKKVENYNMKNNENGNFKNSSHNKNKKNNVEVSNEINSTVNTQNSSNIFGFSNEENNIKESMKLNNSNIKFGNINSDNNRFSKYKNKFNTLNATTTNNNINSNLNYNTCTNNNPLLGITKETYFYLQKLLFLAKIIFKLLRLIAYGNKSFIKRITTFLLKFKPNHFLLNQGYLTLMKEIIITEKLEISELFSSFSEELIKENTNNSRIDSHSIENTRFTKIGKKENDSNKYINECLKVKIAFPIIKSILITNLFTLQQIVCYFNNSKESSENDYRNSLFEKTHQKISNVNKSYDSDEESFIENNNEFVLFKNYYCKKLYKLVNCNDGNMRSQINSKLINNNSKYNSNVNNHNNLSTDIVMLIKLHKELNKKQDDTNINTYNDTINKDNNNSINPKKAYSYKFKKQMSPLLNKQIKNNTTISDTSTVNNKENKQQIQEATKTELNLSYSIIIMKLKQKLNSLLKSMKILNLLIPDYKLFDNYENSKDYFNILRKYNNTNNTSNTNTSNIIILLVETIIKIISQLKNIKLDDKLLSQGYFSNWYNKNRKDRNKNFTMKVGFTGVYGIDENLNNRKLLFNGNDNIGSNLFSSGQFRNKKVDYNYNSTFNKNNNDDVINIIGNESDDDYNNKNLDINISNSLEEELTIRNNNNNNNNDDLNLLLNKNSDFKLNPNNNNDDNNIKENNNTDSDDTDDDYNNKDEETNTLSLEIKSLFVLQLEIITEGVKLSTNYFSLNKPEFKDYIKNNYNFLSLFKLFNSSIINNNSDFLNNSIKINTDDILDRSLNNNNNDNNDYKGYNNSSNNSVNYFNNNNDTINLFKKRDNNNNINNSANGNNKLNNELIYYNNNNLYSISVINFSLKLNNSVFKFKRIISILLQKLFPINLFNLNTTEIKEVFLSLLRDIKSYEVLEDLTNHIEYVSKQQSKQIKKLVKSNMNNNSSTPHCLSYSSKKLKSNSFAFFLFGVFPIVHYLINLIELDNFKSLHDYEHYIDELKVIIKEFRKLFIKSITGDVEFFKEEIFFYDEFLFSSYYDSRSDLQNSYNALKNGKILSFDTVMFSEKNNFLKTKNKTNTHINTNSNAYSNNVKSNYNGNEEYGDGSQDIKSNYNSLTLDQKKRTSQIKFNLSSNINNNSNAKNDDYNFLNDNKNCLRNKSNIENKIINIHHILQNKKSIYTNILDNNDNRKKNRTQIKQIIIINNYTSKLYFNLYNYSVLHIVPEKWKRSDDLIMTTNSSYDFRHNSKENKYKNNSSNRSKSQVVNIFKEENLKFEIIKIVSPVKSIISDNISNNGNNGNKNTNNNNTKFNNFKFNPHVGVKSLSNISLNNIPNIPNNITRIPNLQSNNSIPISNIKNTIINNNTNTKSKVTSFNTSIKLKRVLNIDKKQKLSPFLNIKNFSIEKSEFFIRRPFLHYLSINIEEFYSLFGIFSFPDNLITECLRINDEESIISSNGNVNAFNDVYSSFDDNNDKLSNEIIKTINTIRHNNSNLDSLILKKEIVGLILRDYSNSFDNNNNFHKRSYFSSNSEKINSLLYDYYYFINNNSNHYSNYNNDGGNNNEINNSFHRIERLISDNDSREENKSSYDNENSIISHNYSIDSRINTDKNNKKSYYHSFIEINKLAKTKTGIDFKEECFKNNSYKNTHNNHTNMIDDYLNYIIEVVSCNDESKSKINIFQKVKQKLASNSQLNKKLNLHKPRQRSVSLLLLENTNVNNNENNINNYINNFYALDDNNITPKFTKDELTLLVKRTTTKITSALLLNINSIMIIKNILPIFECFANDNEDIKNYYKKESENLAWQCLARIDYYNLLFNPISLSLLSNSQVELLYSNSLVNMFLRLIENLMFNKESKHWFSKENSDYHYYNDNYSNYSKFVFDSITKENSYIVLFIIDVFKKIVCLESPFMEISIYNNYSRNNALMIKEYFNNKFRSIKEVIDNNGNYDPQDNNFNDYLINILASYYSEYQIYNDKLKLEEDQNTNISNLNHYLCDKIREIKNKIKEHVKAIFIENGTIELFFKILCNNNFPLSKEVLNSSFIKSFNNSNKSENKFINELNHKNSNYNGNSNSEKISLSSSFSSSFNLSLSITIIDFLNKMMMQNRIIQEKIFYLSKTTTNSEFYYSCLKGFFDRDLEFFQNKIDNYSLELINNSIEIDNKYYYYYSNLEDIIIETEMNNNKSKCINTNNTNANSNSSFFFNRNSKWFNNKDFYFINENSIIEDKQQTRLIQNVFLHIKLLAEGHFYNMQSYLRQQTNSKINFNFIQIIVDYLETLYMKIKGLTDEQSAEDLVMEVNDEDDDIWDINKTHNKNTYKGDNIGSEFVNMKFFNYNKDDNYDIDKIDDKINRMDSNKYSFTNKAKNNPIVMFDNVKYKNINNRNNNYIKNPLSKGILNNTINENKDIGDDEKKFYNIKNLNKINNSNKAKIEKTKSRLNKSAQFDFYLINRHFAFMFYERFNSALDFLCEVLQGPCEENQEYIITTKIIDLIDKIIRETEFYNSYNNDLELLTKASNISLQKFKKSMKMNKKTKTEIEYLVCNHINNRVNYMFQKISLKSILKMKKKKSSIINNNNSYNNQDNNSNINNMKNTDQENSNYNYNKENNYENYDLIILQKKDRRLYLELWDYYQNIYTKLFEKQKHKLGFAIETKNKSLHFDFSKTNFNHLSHLGQKQHLFNDLFEYDKSMVLYKLGQLLLAIIEGKKHIDVVITKLLREFEITLLYDKMSEIFLKFVNLEDFSSNHLSKSMVFRHVISIIKSLFINKNGKENLKEDLNGGGNNNNDILFNKGDKNDVDDEVSEDNYDINLLSDDEDSMIFDSEDSDHDNNGEESLIDIKNNDDHKETDNSNKHKSNINTSSSSNTFLKQIKNANIGSKTKKFHKKITSKILKYYNKPLEFFLYSKDNEDLIKEKNQANKKIIAESGLNFYFFLRQLVEINNNPESDLNRLFYIFQSNANISSLTSASLYSKNNSNKILFSNSNTDSNAYSNIIFNNSFSTSERASNFNNINIETYYNFNFKYSFITVCWAFNYFKKNCCEIEVVKDDILYLVQFPKIYIFNDYSKELFIKFREKANRNSLMTKLMSVYMNYKNLYSSLQHLNYIERLFSKIWILNITLNNKKFYAYLSYFLSLLLNLLIISGYSDEDITKEDEITYDGDRLKYIRLFLSLNVNASRVIFLILGIMMLISSLIVFAEFLTKKAPLIFMEQLKSKYFKEFEKRRTYNEYETRKFYKIFSIEKSTEIKFKTVVLLQMLFKSEVIYAIVLFTCTFLALIYHYFFFCFHLFDFIISQKPLLKILKGVLKVFNKLVFIFLLFLATIYFFTLLVFTFFQDSMPSESCSSILICFTNLYQLAFKIGGVGYFLDSSSDTVLMYSFGRYALNIFFVFILSWIFINMKFAFFIDVFSSTREKNVVLQKDIDNICFICGLDRTSLDKIYLDKNGFNKHLEDHNLVNYFCYLFYLHEKEFDELTGIESYVLSLVKKESLDWFPIQRCIKMEKNEMMG